MANTVTYNRVIRQRDLKKNGTIDQNAFIPIFSRVQQDYESVLSFDASTSKDNSINTYSQIQTNKNNTSARDKAVAVAQVTNGTVLPIPNLTITMGNATYNINCAGIHFRPDPITNTNDPIRVTENGGVENPHHHVLDISSMYTAISALGATDAEKQQIKKQALQLLAGYILTKLV